MKTKKIINKLALSKQTVANLENDEMNAVNGGSISASTSTTQNNSCTPTRCFVYKTQSECVCVPTM